MAFMADSLRYSGVLKSGSPRLKSIISIPFDFSSLPMAAIFIVADSFRLVILLASKFIDCIYLAEDRENTSDLSEHDSLPDNFDFNPLVFSAAFPGFTGVNRYLRSITFGNDFIFRNPFVL